MTKLEYTLHSSLKLLKVYLEKGMTEAAKEQVRTALMLAEIEQQRMDEWASKQEAQLR
jgi:hypothetical protein